MITAFFRFTAVGFGLVALPAGGYCWYASGELTLGLVPAILCLLASVFLAIYGKLDRYISHKLEEAM